MPEIFHSRLALACYCAIGAFAGWMLRDDRPIEVATKLNEARELVSAGVEHQTAALRNHQTKRLDNDGLADAIEAESLPLLRNAVGLTEQAAAAGAKGETFDTLAGYAKARLRAAETFVEGIRSKDEAKLAEAKRLTQEGDRLGKLLGAMVAPAGEPQQSAVVYLGR